MANFFSVEGKEEQSIKEIPLYEFFQKRITLYKTEKISELMMEIRGAIKFAYWESHSITADQFQELMNMMEDYGDTTPL